MRSFLALLIVALIAFSGVHCQDSAPAAAAPAAPAAPASPSVDTGAILKEVDNKVGSAVGSLVADIKEVTANVAQTSAELSALKQTVEKVTGSVASISSQVDSNQASLQDAGALDARLKKLEADLSRVSLVVEALNEKVSSANNKNDASAQIEELRFIVDELRQTPISINTDAIVQTLKNFPAKVSAWFTNVFVPAVKDFQAVAVPEIQRLAGEAQNFGKSPLSPCLATF